eukprot:CAMPEP_0194270536 /NCGR_PEP_ID=MMETSP0169-20130528/4505_1 /TAXON_ID=218684 /ORGANISM="Corethron pennatum, Strain L29A3" /LENGTH=97 /DNA_ID=CAMNT_0039012619 /DNA_START=98 /DNA_END=392 /DNA_ORIENTATION=-
MDFETPADYGRAALRILFACSPVLIIVYVLATAREDEDMEVAKVEEAKKSKSCKNDKLATTVGSRDEDGFQPGAVVTGPVNAALVAAPFQVWRRTGR